MSAKHGLFTRYEDVWLLDGLRTPFVDYNHELGQVSPIDLGIKAAREAFARSGVPAADVDFVIESVRAECHARSEFVPVQTLPFLGEGAVFADPLEVRVGGAVVFVLDVERFEKT